MKQKKRFDDYEPTKKSKPKHLNKPKRWSDWEDLLKQPQYSPQQEAS